MDPGAFEYKLQRLPRADIEGRINTHRGAAKGVLELLGTPLLREAIGRIGGERPQMVTHRERIDERAVNIDPNCDSHIRLCCLSPSRTRPPPWRAGQGGRAGMTTQNRNDPPHLSA